MNYHCNVNFRSFKVSNYFSLKDVTPLTPKANVVYCLSGSCDKTQSCIGKTNRHLAVREHLSGNHENLLFITISVNGRTVTLALPTTLILSLKPTQILKFK